MTTESLFGRRVKDDGAGGLGPDSTPTTGYPKAHKAARFQAHDHTGQT